MICTSPFLITGICVHPDAAINNPVKLLPAKYATLILPICSLSSMTSPLPTSRVHTCMLLYAFFWIEKKHKQGHLCESSIFQQLNTPSFFREKINTCARAGLFILLTCARAGLFILLLGTGSTDVYYLGTFRAYLFSFLLIFRRFKN
jgi:hypothetical protein